MEDRTASHAGFSYVASLTGVRAFAILWVIGIHYGRLVTYPEPLRTVVAAGTGAVTLFLVLSGVVLTMNYLHRMGTSKDRADYFRARVARIAPVYLAALGLGVVATTISLHSTPQGFDDLIGRSSAAGKAAALALDVTGLQSWVPWPPWRDAFNSPAWSVSTEIGFYLVFPLVITRLLPRLTTTRAVLRAAGWAFAAMLIVNVLGILAVYHGSAQAQRMMLAGLYTVPLVRLPEFLLGCFAGLLVVRGDVPWGLQRSERRRNQVLLGCLAWSALLLLSAHLGIPSHGPWVLLNLDLRRHVLWLPAFVPGLLVLACGPTVVHRVLGSRPAQALGLASYALYLVHWPVLQLVVLRERKVGNPHPGVLWVALLLAVTLALSFAVHHLFENPARRRILRRADAVPLRG